MKHNGPALSSFSYVDVKSKKPSLNCYSKYVGNMLGVVNIKREQQIFIIIMSGSYSNVSIAKEESGELGLLYTFRTVYLSVEYLNSKQNPTSNNNIGMPPLKMKAAHNKAIASAYLRGNLKIGERQACLASL